MAKQKPGVMTPKNYDEIMGLWPEHSDALNELASAVSKTAYEQGVIEMGVKCVIASFVAGVIIESIHWYKDAKKKEDKKKVIKRGGV